MIIVFIFIFFPSFVLWFSAQVLFPFTFFIALSLLFSLLHIMFDGPRFFFSFKTKPGENIEIFPIIFLHFKIGSNSTLPDIQRNFLPYRMNEWLGNQITEWINTRLYLLFVYYLHLTIWNSCCARSGCFWFKWANEKKTEETTQTISHTQIYR